MFLCEPCHDKVAQKCWFCKTLGFFNMSRGKCEHCGNIENCFDCHGY